MELCTHEKAVFFLSSGQYWPYDTLPCVLICNTIIISVVDCSIRVFRFLVIKVLTFF